MNEQNHLTPGKTINVDFERNSQDLKIPRDIYMKILDKAVRQTEQDIPSLESALSADDFETVQTISHRWKGDFDNMRVKDLSLIAKTMNELTKSGPDKSRIEVCLNQFKEMFVELQKIVPQTPV